MSETLTPVFRLEYFITAAANGTPCDLEPIFNEEKYLHAIAGASVDLPMPIGRTQEYLAKLAGMDVEIPDHPIFRTEYYLAHMIDSTVECPAPIFREEMFYYEWASNEYVTISGNPVSFTAKAAPLRQLSVAFSPKQDLHGYDSPWPAGGGKNLLNTALYRSYPITQNGVTATLNSDGTISLTGTATATSYFSVVNYITLSDYDFIEPDVAYMLSGGVSSDVRLTFGIYGSGTDYADVGDGKKFSFTAEQIANLQYRVVITVANGVNATGITIKPMIEKGDTKTAFAPYENICPISGWSSLTVEQRGKNLFDGTYEPWGVSSDKIASTNGRTAIVPIKGGEKYTINKIGTSNRSVYYEAYETPIVGTPVVKIGETTIPMTVTTSANAKYLVIYVSTSSEQAEPQMTVVLGETASDYVPYNPSSRSIAISLGQTVYSGTVDVVTGGGEVTMAEVDLGSMSWTVATDSTVRQEFRSGGVKDDILTVAASVAPNAYCTIFVPASRNNQTSGTNPALNSVGVTSTGLLGVVVPPNSYADKDVFKTAMNGVKLVYELAQPIPIQLTPQEVQSLAGDNVLFSDANGDLTVEYRSN